MAITSERFVVDDAGEKVAVLLQIDVYRRLLDAFEEIESIRAYDAATSGSEREAVPLEQAAREIDTFRK